MSIDLKLTVGPIAYYWPKGVVRDFYAKLASMPVDCVHVGETVCSKRREMVASDWLELAHEISDSGKEVVISTLALIEARSELAMLKRIAGNTLFMIEANDLAGIEIAASMNLPFATGPTVNIYNGRTLAVLQSKGLVRWVPPVELSGESVREILAEFRELKGIDDAGELLETEIFAYGRLPLAHSARCFTARFHDRPKDACGFVCIEHPEGLRAHTRDGEPFLRMNGIQVQSDAVHCVQDLEAISTVGANRVRLSPTGHADTAGFFDAVETYSSWLAGEPARLAKESLVQENLVAGYWFGQPGMQDTPGG